ncbi:MAG TPA: M48 family metalloprotease [Actinomycetales bacterium]|nr:M48 family metalloprotease [Actinomycetales bacterium]
MTAQDVRAAAVARSASSLRAPVVAAVVLGVALVAVAAVAVPWSVLGRGAPAVQPSPSTDFSAAQLQRDAAFHAALRAWTYPRLALGIGLALVLGLSPWGGRLVFRVGRLLGGSWPAQVLGGTVVLTAIPVLAGVPLGIGAERVLRRYGLSTQGWGGWAVDVARAWAVAAVVTALLLLVLVALARRWPQRWWLPAAALAAAVTVAGSALYPVLIEPLANDFTPMAAGPQRTALLDLAIRDGVPVRDVLVADASRRTTTENAYVSGLGATRRIVVYDTLLRSASPREVELVVAHELGHAKAHDVRLGTTLGALAAALAAVLLFLVLEGRRWWRQLLDAEPSGSGIAGPARAAAANPRAIALILALATIGGYLAAPASTLVSRRTEARADLHALNLTRDPEGFAGMQRRLATSNISDLQPRWYRTLLFATHPAPPWRIAMARAWAQEHGLPGPTRVAR